MSNAANSAVDRETALQHLELANKHVAEGQKRIDAQLALVAKLARDGHDTLQAKSLLEQFEQTLALQLETRDRIVQELGEGR
jgi:hypothetical protein